MEKESWYAVRTFPGYEFKVREKLEKQIAIEKKENVIHEIYIPIRQKYIFSRKKLKLKEDLLFPGYILVNMEFTNDTFYFVRGIQYVTGYAGISSMKQIPKPIKDSEYESMIEEVKKIEIDLESGDKVIIINHDLYNNQQATVKEINLDNKEILVKFEEEKILTTVKFIQIEKK